MGGWAIVGTFTSSGSNTFPSSPRLHTEAQRAAGPWAPSVPHPLGTWSSSQAHRGRGPRPRADAQGPGAPRLLPQAAGFLHGAAPAPLGRGRPQGCPGGPPRARCREGAQRASVPGGHHPLAGPSQPAGKPLPAGPAAKPPALQRAPRSQLRAQDRSPLPAPRRRGPPTDAPPLGCPGLAGALLRG